MRLPHYFMACLLAALLLAHAPAYGQPPQARQIDVDDAADEERLNRELWETMKGLPYSAAKEHIARGQREQTPQEAVVTLPTGWKIAPAGSQVGVGRLPYTAVASAGQIVVQNTG